MHLPLPGLQVPLSIGAWSSSERKSSARESAHMKSLTILRHGKAVHSEKHPVDSDRPLTKRGHKDIARATKVLKQLTPPIDWIVSSPALRARQTADAVAKELGLQDQIVAEPGLYELGADAILPALGKIPSEVEHALVVGHNPVLEELVSGLCAGSVSRLANSLPTAGIASLELQIMWWEQVRWGCGLLRLYLRPRLLRGL